MKWSKVVCLHSAEQPRTNKDKAAYFPFPRQSYGYIVGAIHESPASPSRPLRYLTREGNRATTQGRPYDTVKAVPQNKNTRKENAEFPRQRAAGAIPALSEITFCVVPTVNFACKI